MFFNFNNFNDDRGINYLFNPQLKLTKTFLLFPSNKIILYSILYQFESVVGPNCTVYILRVC